MLSVDNDTICAIATSPGKSGIGIIRISGPSSKSIAEQILGFNPTPRHEHFSGFYDNKSVLIDQGIALFFESPNSFTGEDVLELQGHGGVFILNSILKAIISYGARLARPGEFSERAFLNSKLDLAQVEAIADVINASTEQAARSALRTLEGKFSKLIQELVEKIVELRVYLEAAIDFTEEEIDFLSEGHTTEKLHEIISILDTVFQQAKQGSILRDGITVAIAGKPNAGKSSLLNTLSGKPSAIVTDIPGTTRDVLTELIDVDGMPVHIIDTAGLRQSQDVVEQEGIKRAHKAITDADLLLLVIDVNADSCNAQSIKNHIDETGLPYSLFEQGRGLVVLNKVDLIANADTLPDQFSLSNKDIACVKLSAKTGDGIEILREELTKSVGFSVAQENSFIARERHIVALSDSLKVLKNALHQLEENSAAELVAEDLRMAQKYLGQITGEFTTDDLLGEIFSNFCVGK
jgi:tRNA modification GTPase